MNMSSPLKHWQKYVFLLILCVGFPACKKVFFQNTSPESLREKVDIVWKAKIQSDWGPVYDVADSEFQKSTERNRFITKSHYQVTSYKIIELRVNEDQKSAVSLIEFDTVKMGTKFKISVSDAWVVEDGEWRLHLSNPKTPFS